MILRGGIITTIEPLRNKTFFWMKRLLILQSTLLLVMMLGITSSWAQVSFTVDAPSPVNVGDRFRVEFTVDSEPGVGTRITVAFPPYRQAVEENI